MAEKTGCRQPQGKVCMICRLDEYLGADNQCYTKDVYCTLYLAGVCTKCYDSFFLDANNQCKEVQVGCVYQNRQCVSCNAPFIYSNGQCLISGCVKYCNQGCLTCDSRLTLSGYTCGLPHCQQISSNYECLQCSSGYELNQANQCVLADPNCIKRNSMNVCLSCKTGFRLDVSGFCSTQKFGCNYVDGRCTSCRAPFDYIPATESCEIDGCLSYFVGGCKSCNSDYSLLYNTCKLPNCLISRNSKCI